MKILDTNMILRYMLDDDKESADFVRNILVKDAVLVLPEVLAEVVYVLAKVYRVDRIGIAESIEAFLTEPNVQTERPSVIDKGLFYYKTTSLDFVDCLLCAYQTEAGYEVCTFDKKLNKLIARETGN